MTSTSATAAAPTTNTMIAALKAKPVVVLGSSRYRVNATSRGCRRASYLAFGTLILGAVGAAAKALETARQSRVAKPATRTIVRMEFSFAVSGATVLLARPRQSSSTRNKYSLFPGIQMSLKNTRDYCGSTSIPVTVA